MRGLLLATIIPCLGLTGCTMLDRIPEPSTRVCDVDVMPVVCPGADLSGSDLSGIDLTDAVLTNADLSGANLEGTITTGAELTGVTWNATICPDGTTSDDAGGSCGGHLMVDPCPRPGVVTLECAGETGADLLTCGACHVTPYADCRCANGVGSDLRYAQLNGADLHGAQLLASDLRYANFVDASLEDADLRGAALHGVEWGNTICPDGTNSDDNGQTCGGHLDPDGLVCHTAPGAECPAMNLVAVDLRYANLVGADLGQSTLVSADMSYADLREASFARANAGDVTFHHANLEDADFSFAILESALWENTICPDGTNSDDNGDTCGGHLTDLSELCEIRPGAYCPQRDFTGVDLRYANLAGATLDDSIFAEAQMTRVSMTGVTVNGSVFDHANMRSFQGSNLVMQSGSLVGAELADANLRDSQLSELVFSDENGVANMASADLTRALITGCGFKNVGFAGSTWSGVTSLASCFQDANLSGATLDSAVLVDSSFERALLTGADLHNLQVSFSCFLDSRMRGMRASELTLTRSDLRRADMRESALSLGRLATSDFREANLDGAELRSVEVHCLDMRDAVLTNVDFTGSTIQFTDLTGADMTGSTFNDVVFRGVIISDEDQARILAENDNVTFVEEAINMGSCPGGPTVQAPSLCECDCDCIGPMRDFLEGS